jgi:hypothetical protein
VSTTWNKNGTVGPKTRLSRYTDPVERLTITLDEELFLWARNKAVDANISLSKLIAELLERERQAEYWRAYEQWKARDRDLGVDLDASQRLSRDQIYER